MKGKYSNETCCRKEILSSLSDYLVPVGTAYFSRHQSLSKRFSVRILFTDNTAVCIPNSYRILLSGLRRYTGCLGIAPWKSLSFVLLSSHCIIYRSIVWVVSHIQYHPVAVPGKISLGEQISQMVWHRCRYHCNWQLDHKKSIIIFGDIPSLIRDIRRDYYHQENYFQKEDFHNNFQKYHPHNNRLHIRCRIFHIPA